MHCLLKGGPILIVVLKTLHFELFLLNRTYAVFDPHWIEAHMTYAKSFLWQNIVGILFTAHLAGAMSIADDLSYLLSPVARLIRLWAGFTLSIYLLHHPIEMMIAAILHNHPDGPIKTAVVISGAVALAVSIGFFIEPRRYWLKAFLSNWYERFLRYEARRNAIPAASE